MILAIFFSEDITDYLRVILFPPPSPQERISDDHFIKDHQVILLHPSFLHCFCKATSSRWILKGSGER